MKPYTKEEWQKAVTELQSGPSQVHYIIRCFNTGDEEELQVGELDEGFHRDVIMALYDELPFDTWQDICKRGYNWYRATAFDQQRAIGDALLYHLKQHMKLPELFKRSDTLWESLFWCADDESRTYESFLEACEDF